MKTTLEGEMINTICCLLAKVSQLLWEVLLSEVSLSPRRETRWKRQFSGEEIDSPRRKFDIFTTNAIVFNADVLLTQTHDFALKLCMICTYYVALICG